MYEPSCGPLFKALPPRPAPTDLLGAAVPPTILDEESSPSTVSIREKHNASLICKAAGVSPVLQRDVSCNTRHVSQVPQPSITWRREDGRAIYRDTALARPSVQQGEYLELQDISREQMGAYLCIASNKIPPSVSKRITLVVEFQPMMYIPNQLIGAPVHTQVTMECTTEASPKVGLNSEESVQYIE